MYSFLSFSLECLGYVSAAQNVDCYVGYMKWHFGTWMKFCSRVLLMYEIIFRNNKIEDLGRFVKNFYLFLVEMWVCFSDQLKLRKEVFSWGFRLGKLCSKCWTLRGLHKMVLLEENEILMNNVFRLEIWRVIWSILISSVDIWNYF